MADEQGRIVGMNGPVRLHYAPGDQWPSSLRAERIEAGLYVLPLATPEQQAETRAHNAAIAQKFIDAAMSFNKAKQGKE